MNSRFVQRLSLLAIVIILAIAGSNTAQMPATAQGAIDPRHLISLQYGDFDTRMGEPVLPPSLRLDAYHPDEAGYYLVQFTGAILPKWKTALEAAGAEPLGYVPNNAFIVRMTEAQRALVADLQQVQWIGIYQPAYGVAPWMPSQDKGEDMLVVLTFPGGDLEQIVAQLEAWGGKIFATTENKFRGKVRVSIDLSYVPQIAQLNGVMWIEPWIEPQLANDVARGIMDVEDTVWNTHGLYGAGQVVAVADTGLDVGQNNASMSDDFEGGIVNAYCLGRSNPCDWSDPNGHGTHVAGSAVGNGRNSGSDPHTRNYAGSYAGIAPEAQLVFQSIMDAGGSLDGLPDDLNDLFQQAYDDGARVHSNSWGAPVNGAYDHNAYEVDQFVWNNPDMVVLFAAGNEGIDANADGVVDLDSISPPGTAKNVITVGATENLRPSGGFTGRWGDGWPSSYPSNPIHDDFVSNNYNGMAAFSSRGPVDGDRIKPDLVAPGTNILCARTHQHTMSMDAESGANGWTADPTWVITTTHAHGGTHSWATGSYGNNHNVSLTSPVIDIRTGADTIGFWTRYDLGVGDTGYTEYYNGTQWIQCDWATGTQNDWVFRSCGLPTPWMTDNAKQNLRVRFRLESDNADTGTGWYVDDIQVTPQGWGFDYQAGVPNEHYMYMGGTSMATPLVAGSAALVREYYMGRGHMPSAALVRATLVNGAVDIAPGQYGTGATQEIPDTRPNNVAGWGRVNLQESLFPAAPQIVLYQDVTSTDGLNTNETHFYRYEVRDFTVPFRATLVWTDFPSFPFIGKGHVNNDLDLQVRMPDGSLLYPNSRTDADPSNNIEDIFLDTADVITGTYVIMVTGRNVPDGPQAYALVVRGGNLSILQRLDILQPTSLSPVNAGPHDNPHKIIVYVTKPLSGLTKTDFQVRIGGISLPQPNIISFFESSYEYVLEIQPPNQPANGLYSLTVTTGNFIDTEQEAILYADTNNVDVALVLDRSGSMGTTKMNAAKDAAKQFVDFMQIGDMVGVVSFDDVVETNFPLTTIESPSSVPPVFSDDMESGMGNWSADAPWGLTTASSHSPSHAWTDSPGGNYDNNVNISLRTAAPINVSSAITTPVLSFWQRYELESGYDGGYVEVSTDGGSSWTSLTNFTGTNLTWHKVELDLTAYKGQSVLVRYRLSTDYSVTRDGWYIDDVTIGQSTADTKTLAKSAIDSLYRRNMTSIGGGLQRGQEQLSTRGNANHPWAIVLLSDGLENTAPYVADVLPTIKASKTVVHTVGLGSDADEALMLDIASQTEGTYNFAPTPEELSGIYNTIAGAVADRQTLLATTGIAQQGVTDQIDVVVDSTVSDAIFSVSWSNSSSTIDLTLRKPNGDIIDPTVAASDPSIEYVAGSTYKYYRIKAPTLVAGVWQMRITGGSVSAAAGKAVIATTSGEPYVARVTAQASLTMRFYLGRDDYLTTEPVKLIVTLSDNQPIQGAAVTVEVEPPSQAAQAIRSSEWIEVNGDTMPDPARVAKVEAQYAQATTSVTLYDDGMHDDGAANDGVYANTFSGTYTEGTYVFSASASGTSNTGEAFARQAELSTYLAQNPFPNINVRQVTTDPSDDWRPAIARASDGKLWVVWHSWRSDSNIWYKTSDDNGVTWSADIQLTTDPSSDYDPVIMQASDGTIWVVWYSYRSGNADIWYKASTDGGTTWSSAIQLTTDPSSDYSPTITQASDGTIWVVWHSYRSGNADIWYKTSSDGGTTWSLAVQLTTAPEGDYRPAIAQTNDGTIWVLWDSWRSDHPGIWYKTSTDGGASWSTDAEFSTDTDWDYDPAIAQTSDGTIWVARQSWSWDLWNWDIWYKTSTDGGITWSADQQFTQFTGDDLDPGLAALPSDQVALVWSSDRAVNYDVWFGIIGVHGDVNPPPHLDEIEHDPWPNPDSNDTVTIRADVSDETSVASVILKWWVDSTPQADLTMYDDGAHDDYGADDGWYGVQIGPFPVGTVVEYQVEVTDVDGNTVTAPQYPESFEVLEPFVKTADILFVPDRHGDDTSWFASYYTDALDALGYSYDVWNTHLRGEIDQPTLNQYANGAVVWAVPDWGYVTDNGSSSQASLESYLDNGGRLFISGQDVGSYTGGSTFYSDYLHATYVQDDTDLYGLNGVSGDPISDGLYLAISGGDGANNQYYPSEIDPIAPAVTIFGYDPGATTALAEPILPEEVRAKPEQGLKEPYLERPGKPKKLREGAEVQGIVSSGTGAIRVDTGTYKVVYFAFGFEAINGQSGNNRGQVMARVLDWLGFAAEPLFDDVPSGHWAYDYIQAFALAGITGGCSADPPRYCPDDPVTRAQMAVFIVKALREEPVANPAGIFNDVPPSHWAAGYIERFSQLGITEGCGEGKFCPEENVTRAQMAVFLDKALGLEPYNNPTPTFEDVPPDHWAYGYIEKYYQQGITAGCGIDPLRYCPEDLVTRAQMAVFMVKAFNIPL